jgi:hypothetical protein
MTAFTVAACANGAAPAPMQTTEVAPIVLSPLETYLSRLTGSDLSPEAQLEQARVDAAQIEDLMAQCMKDQGFDYIPDIGHVIGQGFPAPRPDDRDWVTLYGYGLINQPPQPAPSPYTDPNAAYLRSLSDAEYQAFSYAAYGDPNAEEGTSERTGCGGQAWDAVHAAQEAVTGAEEFQPLFDAITEFQQTPYPGQTELDAAWAGCMADAGYPNLTQPAEASEWFNATYLQPLWQTFDANNQKGQTRPPEYDSFADQEVTMALADLDCREAVNYRATFHDLQWAAETQFVADHQSELDALMAALDQGR